MGATEKALKLAIKKLEQERSQTIQDFDKKIAALNEALGVFSDDKKPTRRRTKRTKKAAAPKKTKKTRGKTKKAAAPKKEAKKNGSPRNGTLQKAIVDILAASKDPIHINEILETLAGNGHKIEKRNLATRLSTMKKSNLVSNETTERGYWFAS